MEVYYEEMKKSNSYDVTVDATIVDVSRKPEGVYRVKTDNAEFEAYASSGEYYKNDSVLVQIPNGNYKNQKFILGRKTDDQVANQTFHFKLPFDDFIGLRHLNRNNNELSGQYWANYPSYQAESKEPIWEWQNNGSSTIGNTRLGIEADWQTLLGHYQPLRGIYGFRIVVTGVNSATEERASEIIERTFYFTNRDMYGNTYAFYTPYTQQKVLDITEFLNIHNIKIYFYQDYAFADGDNNIIYYDAYQSNGKPAIPENIIFNNVNIYLGISAENIKDETVLLYSYDQLGYTGIEEKVVDKDGDLLPTGNWLCNENHELRMVWVHYEKDGTFSVIDNLEELLKQEKTSGKDTHIYWYRYNYDENIKTNPTELFFPGQQYESDSNGEYIPKVDNTVGYPIFDESDDPIVKAQREEYRYLAKDLMDSAINPDYEAKIERYGGTNWTFIPGMTDTFVQNIIPRGEKSREKFKIVIQHHGTHTTSTELVLKNSRDVESEIAGNARNDSIIIKCFKLKKKLNDDGEWINDEYTAVEDGSLNAFYVYDENNNILVNDDNERFDAHEYYVQIHARNEDTSLYELLEVKDELGQPTGSLISWAFPNSYSMIRSVLEVTENDAKYFNINPIAEPLRWENFHKATMKFTINPVLNNRYLDNTVGAVINRNGKEYHIEKAFQFGRAESLGHEYLPILEIIYPVGGTYLCNSGSAEFQIGCTVYHKDGTPFETPQTLTFSWRQLGNDQVKIFNRGENYLGDNTDGYLIGDYHHRDDSINKDQIGTMTKELETHYREKYSKYHNNVVYGFIASNSAPPIFEVTVHGAADYPLTVRKGFMICNNHIYKQPRDIMIPDRVEFKSDGAAPVFYTNPFEVIYTNTYNNGQDIERIVEYPNWEINNTLILSLESSTVARSTVEKTANGNTGTVDHDYQQFRLKFNTDGTPQWLDSYLKPTSYTYISYTDGTNKIAQAIVFDRNTYASSLVNEWDGTSLTWDEENGAILSTMIAAGTKDSSNRFTGVMMGDWHTKGDESLDVPGMYGYDKGAQSFGFKTDGSAFIGKSGKGRIEFDGNTALISNAKKNCYINLNPINRLLSLSDPENQSFSENFIYCQIEKADNSFSDLVNGIMGPDSWARQYFEDKDHEYFVVDPNYGVLTTGGVVARYGSIGNWMISDQGLYQKAAGKYMYIGYNPAKAQDPNSTDETTYAIYAGTDFGGDGNDPGFRPGINPYFYVTWDGTLFARKGLIANTWTIDDTSLTYKVLSTTKTGDLTKENIYDKIYIGKPEANSGIIEGDTASNKNRWAISAGWQSMNKVNSNGQMQENGTEKNNIINFGVTLFGELYAQLGTIAGWTITSSELYSKNAKIRLLSDGYIYAGTPYIVGEKEYYPITIDANSGLMSIMNMVQDSTGNASTSGYIYLGNYNLESSSTNSWSIPTNISIATKTPVSTSLGDTYSSSYSGNWDDSASYSVNSKITFTTTGATASTQSITLSTSNTFNIVARDTSNNYGVSIVTGKHNTNNAVAIYPKNIEENLASLGTKENPWNIYAGTIYCSAFETAGSLAAKTILMNTEMVATEPWVIAKLNAVYNALNQVSAGGAANTASIGKLSGGLSAKVTVKVVKDVQSNMAYMDLVGQNVKGDETWRCESIASTNHSHTMTLSAAGKLNLGITAAWNADNDVDLSHDHSVTGSVSSSGILTLTWGKTNFNGATGSSTIDLSSWLNAAKLEGWNLACDYISYTRNTVFGPTKNSYASGGKVLATYTPSSGSTGSSGSSSLRVGSTTYKKDYSAIVTNQRVDYDHFSSSGGSYSASSFNWIGY